MHRQKPRLYRIAVLSSRFHRPRLRLVPPGLACSCGLMTWRYCLRLRRRAQVTPLYPPPATRPPTNGHAWASSPATTTVFRRNGERR
ncbi:hypothetical protein [Micromonospora sp. AKA38]|uniref:hypothetical protein n=1 Tax=Micromonospora sp. AKA38 TaxID=2733861 RepID=UPI0022C9133E|nr:hypothetical protein [Micromonospora sp. AKA38]GHJ14025.1 hypothetical protein TPA0908_20200 [Micromonospora sp. AKA38]